MSDITRAEIEALIEKAKKATPGPWERHRARDQNGIPVTGARRRNGNPVPWPSTLLV